MRLNRTQNQLNWIGRLPLSQDDEFTYRYKDYELETIILNMLGEHQKENAALVITALIELNERQIIELDFNKMIDGIESVNWTGRIEQVKRTTINGY